MKSMNGKNTLFSLDSIFEYCSLLSVEGLSSESIFEQYSKSLKIRKKYEITMRMNE